MPQFPRTRRLHALVFLALGAPSGCAWWSPLSEPVPEFEFELVPAHAEWLLDHELDATIAHALPTVSYQSDNPAMTEPLGRNDPTVVLPRIRTLDGEGRIVCRKDTHHAFGKCAFPSLTPTAP